MRLWLTVLCVFAIQAQEAQAEDFAGEAYLIGSSVSDNGTSGALPSRFQTASQYLDFPGDIGDGKLLRLEMATLPLFNGLSQSLNGAVGYSVDSNTHVNAFLQTVTTGDIQVLPLLQGTAQDRLNDPGFRPAPCDGCQQLRDVVYMTNVNIMRKWDFEFPRSDISSRPIPMNFTLGMTTKYFYEELEGGDYLAQNLNVDLGACLKFYWGYNPVTHFSDRDVKIQASGFELLPTKQRSDFSETQVYENISRRYHLSASWEEIFPDWNSTVALGATQKSEGGKYPAVGVEWDFHEIIYLRGGWDSEYLSAGASVAYRWFSVHYALRHHELGTSFYQVSGQVQWP